MANPVTILTIQPSQIMPALIEEHENFDMNEDRYAGCSEYLKQIINDNT